MDNNSIKPLTKNMKAIFELSKTFDGDFTFNQFKDKLVKLENKLVATLPNIAILNYLNLLERRGLMKIKKNPGYNRSNLYRIIKRD